jgi:putative ABC transport system substrate-binding protein
VGDRDIPILFCVVSDPLGSGIVEAVGEPSNTNISGVVYSHLRDTKVEMVMRVLDETYRFDSVRIGIVSSDYPASIGDVKELMKITDLYENIQIIHKQIPYRPIPQELPQLLESFEQAIKEIEDDVDYLWQAGGPLSEIEEASRLILNAAPPLILANTPRAVEMGGLMAVATNYSDTGLQVVEMVDQIFQGRNVGSIPVAVPRKFDLYINMATAESLGISIPSHMLMIAGDKIYW